MYHFQCTSGATRPSYEPEASRFAWTVTFEFLKA